jgi:predicted Zn-dependent protease with MMP-like domain
MDTGQPIDADEFELLVEEAVVSLPHDFRRRMENVEVLVQQEPVADQLRGARVPAGHTLLGLYQGVPLTSRSGMPPLFPDRITLFRGPILRACRTPEEAREQIRRTVIHEIAHFFGISDDRLRELDAY